MVPSLTIYIIAMLFVESMLVIKEAELPRWFLPQRTPHDVVTFLHRLYPALMNGSRSILGAFYEDPKLKREEKLQQIVEVSRANTLKAFSLMQFLLAGKIISKDEALKSSSDGIIADTLRAARKLVNLSADKEEVNRSVEAKAALIKDPIALRRRQEQDQPGGRGRSRYMWVAYLGLYLAARFLFIKSASSSSSPSHSSKKH